MGSQFPVPVDRSMETLPPKSRIRQRYPADFLPNGDYAPLPYGRVRYWILGPENGTKVALIHGISTPAMSWTEIAPYLAEHGFRVLVYDLYGKGYSEAPHTTYDWTLFCTQLALLLQYVRWEAAHIVGFSLGGGIAAAFTASLPHLVSGKAVLIASAGLLEYRRRETKQTEGNSAAPKSPQYKEFRDLQASSLPGYKRTIQSCYQDGPVRHLEAAFDKLATILVGPAQQSLQVLIIHGTEDEVVPVAEADKIKSRVPQAEVFKVEGAAHDIVNRDGHWQVVAQNIVRFFR
ncbi:alpha/beta-hydrolase [Cubamyces sp. BRFM 1775]|nr:alpha/beta-hydrolase [Cubamyces sp. BRFM 1775]